MPRPKKLQPSPLAAGLLTWRQVRAEFGISRSALYRLTNAGVLSYVDTRNRRVGRLVPRKSLEKYRESQLVRGEF